MCLRGGIRPARACAPPGAGTNTAAASVAFKKKSVVSCARATRASSRASARKTTETSNLGVRHRLASRRFESGTRARTRARGAARGTTSAAAHGTPPRRPPRASTAAPADAGDAGFESSSSAKLPRARGREHQRTPRTRAPRARRRRAGRASARQDVPPEPPQLGRGEALGNGAVPVEMGDIRRSHRDSMRARGAKTTTRGEDDDARRRRRREATTTTRAHPRAPEWPWESTARRWHLACFRPVFSVEPSAAHALTREVLT